jgi:hypothetical protein
MVLPMNIQELPKEVWQHAITMWAAEAAIWTPVQLVNFRFLPAQHQQMFVNLMAVVEAAVMSWYVFHFVGAVFPVQAAHLASWE